MGISCEKSISINVKAGACPQPTLKVWLNAAVTGRNFDYNIGNFFNDVAFVTSTGIAWVVPSQHNATWFVESYNMAAASPIPSVGLFAVDDGAFPQAQSIIYVQAVDKIVILRQHFNGATYDLWLSFVASNGIEISHLTGLTTETNRNFFSLVDKPGLTDSYIGWLSGTDFYLIDVTTGTAPFHVALAGIAGNYGSFCYCCATDSFFIRHLNDLQEYNRSDLTLKNTYAGAAIGCTQIDYIKTTQELWLWPQSAVGAFNVRIIDPTNGNLKATMATVDGFDGWTNDYGAARSYNEKLNAWCIPGPTPGFSGNPIIYYFYDVVSRALKKQIDISAEFNAGFMNQWFGQSMDVADGSVFLSGSNYNPPGVQLGVFEIGTS